MLPELEVSRSCPAARDVSASSVIDVAATIDSAPSSVIVLSVTTRPPIVKSVVASQVVNLPVVCEAAPTVVASIVPPFMSAVVTVPRFAQVWLAAVQAPPIVNAPDPCGVIVIAPFVPSVSVILPAFVPLFVSRTKSCAPLLVNFPDAPVWF